MRPGIQGTHLFSYTYVHMKPYLTNISSATNRSNLIPPLPYPHPSTPLQTPTMFEASHSTSNALLFKKENEREMKKKNEADANI